MKIIGRTLIAAVLILFATGALAADKAQIARGKYLVEVGSCNDCHTPKIFGPQGMKLDESRRMSGSPAGAPMPPVDKKALTPGYWVMFSPDLTAAVGPWGMTYSANLTPDEKTGIGLWTEDNFVKALKTGKHMGEGRQIMPPMPWEFVGQMTEEDLKAIFAYLKTLPPVSNAVTQPIAPADVK